MKPKISARELETELSYACALLKNNFRLEFPRPTLYVGDTHRSRFIEVSSMGGLVRSYLIQMVYDDETNGIFVPDSMLGPRDWRDTDNGRTNRIFCFLHECVHAYHTHINPELRQNCIDALLAKKARAPKERGYIYIVFDEGAATYVSIQAALASGNALLIDYGQEEHRKLADGWNDWKQKNLPFMAQVFKMGSEDLRAVLYRYLWKKLGAGLMAHKYLLGYEFMSAPNLDAISFKKMSTHPPRTVMHIVYPETYAAELKKKK